ncbi:matrix-remodeling-associated protein 5 [Parambassis ranga]|uniref:Matrix-remodeling-associated protein 5 n=1 Tax=Parambassis ranga TaxID=210632 RepID=A0A6P7HWL1_9TELE|nr:matrix-remodeling-associated protein 5 [Parambassis ranga]
MDHPALRVLQTLLVVLVVVVALTPAAAASVPVPCPRPCSCPQPAELHCTFRSLLSIPAAVPKHMERMNLGFNSIGKITEKSLAGLRKLELLMVHGNDIHSVPDGAFRDLTSLQMLKMSYNKLKEINRQTLHGLWSLARLHLDHNRLEFIHPDAFQGLTSLRLLQLEGNLLQQLHPATFATFTMVDHIHVSTLRHLFLSDNGLMSLPSEMVATTPQLENLYLHGNPWTCDCNMKWLQDWNATSPGILKCKKDRALPGGQLCPQCSSPRHLRRKELHTVEDLVCSSPVINSRHRTTPPEDAQSEVLTVGDFKEPFGNISLGLSDEHGNEVNLDCSISEPRDLTKMDWEQVDRVQLAFNITLSVDLECAVDRDKYEQLWRLIAYYSSVPAHLQREVILSEDPHPTYVYRQDSEKDALYYTGVKVNMMARPAWLMQKSVDLQLNRPQSSAKVVKLILSTGLSETLEAELVRRQRRTWVTVESTNATRKVASAILGSQMEMGCNVHSSGRPVIRWMLPDGTKVESPHGLTDKGVSVSTDGRLVIKAVRHSDAGIYYCIARVQGDFAVLPFHLTVQESSSPPPGEVITPTEGFIGSPISLPCMASGSPDADINWILPSSSIVSFKANSSRAFVFTNGTLHIQQPQLLDGGFYKCIAVNLHGVDTLATKVTVNRRTELIRSLRKFPVRPQSASGVNTQIRVPTEDAEETSGDSEEAPVNPFRRRIPGNVAPDKRGSHPSRKMWRRPPVLWKPTESQNEERKNEIENRRRINVSKGKIDPEKWADILAKIRDRNSQVSVTVVLAQQTTQPQDAIEGSSDGMKAEVKKDQNRFTTPLTHTTVEHTTSDMNVDTHMSLNRVQFLQQTTSAPPHTVTFWQTSTNIASSSTFSPEENSNSNTDGVDGVTTADWSKDSESMDRLRDQMISLVSQESGKYLSETLAMLTTATPITMLVPPTTRSNRKSRLRQPNSRRRNGTRRKRPNRKKQKLNKPTPTTAPQKTTTSSSPQLKIEPTTSFSTSAPFTGSQEASSDRLSHTEITVSRQDQEAASSTTVSPHERNESHLPLAKPLFTSTSAAPLFPTASPGVSHGESPTEGASTTQQRFTGSTLSHVKPLEETQRASTLGDLGPLPRSSNSSGGFNNVDQDINTPTSTAPVTLHDVKTTSVYTTSGLMTTPNMSFEGSKVTPITSPVNAVTSRALPHVTPLPKVDLSLWATSQDTPRTTLNSGQYTTELRTSAIHPATTSPTPDRTLSTLQVNRTATPAPEITTIPVNPSLLTSTQDVSRQHQLPGHGSSPRGKPSIANSNFQTFTVKAETDAQLPCEAEGEPMPFMSWTKVSSGAIIAQNTRVQRFEVHQNGTLIIRNVQLTDRDQYLCTVQNQYGVEKMVVNLDVMSQHPRVLQPRHRDVTVHLGSRVELECKAEGHPVPQVTWVLPNQIHVPATSSGVRVAVAANGSLQISQASYTDRGIYRCTGNSAAGADTVSVHLHVSALPPVIQQARHENLTVSEGGVAYMHCTTTGAPHPVVRWMTPDGVQLTAFQMVTGRNFIVYPNGTLYIHSLGPGNVGRYECSASNTVSSSKRTVILSLRRNQSFAKASITSTSPQRTDVIYGSKLLLNCVATGEPEPRIMWRTPSKKLVDAEYSFDSRIKVFPNGTITIHPATDKDGGDYLCVARNKMGDDYILLHVNVLTRPAKIEQKAQRSSQEVVYGGDLKVDCVASGLPNPEISWALPDGTMVNLAKQRESSSVGRSRRYVVFDNGTLYFNDVGTSEEGDYTCYAENQLGKDEMKVRVKVKAVTSPPKIQDKHQKVDRVFYGETVTLRCNAKGEPAPVITWISPTNRVISPGPDKHQVLDDGTLVVQKVQRYDRGNYTCTARNSAGQDHKVTRLEVLVTPPTINGLRETAINVTVVQDQRKLLDCVAKGTPTPRIMWVLPGNVILPAPYFSNRMSVHLNGTLEILSPKMTDSGQLVCIARNEGGEVRLVVNLDVKEVIEKPQIRGPQADPEDSLSITAGNAMTLNCSFKGLALSQGTWILPNGTPLLSGARFSKFFHHPDGSLIISNPSVSEVGLYRCLGRNSGGLMERLFTLSPGRKPQIQNRYTSPISIMNGDTLLLHCQTTGEPHRLTWTLPTGVVLNRPQRVGHYAVLPNGTLAIQQVSVYDRGPYGCRAANEYGSSVLSVSVMVIAYPPRITNGPPSVTYTKRGVAVQLNCVATGIPKAEVAWETPDKTRLAVSTQPRLFRNKYLQPQGSLIIQNPTQRDAGIYRCTARNAVGIDSKATFLNVF